MPRKKNTAAEEKMKSPAIISDQPIVDTIEKNYMPYAMSVIVSRAIPEIDGFKPSHRKLLYTMYKLGLMTGNRMKSATVAGRTMALNPHGDAGIYDTLVRLTTNRFSIRSLTPRARSVSTTAETRRQHPDIPRSSLSRSARRYSAE